MLLADLLALIVLSASRLGTTRWLRHSPGAALVIAVVQVFVEGPRWQTLPAYVLTGLFFVVSMLYGDLFAGRSAGRRRPARMAVGLGILGLAISGALPMVMPEFRFPHPTGPFAIGTLTYHWVAASRADIFTADPNARRELMVQIWYPANAAQTALNAPYMPETDAVMAAFARIHDKLWLLFSQFKYVTTNAIASVRVADGQATYAVLIFLEGATGFRQLNTSQVEELASHGYIVADVDQPGAAADVVFPNGHEVTGVPVLQLQA